VSEQSNGERTDRVYAVNAYRVRTVAVNGEQLVALTLETSVREEFRHPLTLLNNLADLDELIKALRECAEATWGPGEA
jgi:hypothetical protein